MSTRGNIFYSSQGIYGSPLATGLNTKKVPTNPKIVTPDISKRNGGSIENWKPGNNNSDLLQGVTE